MSMQPQTFALKEHVEDEGAPVLSVRGELDLYTTPEFEERLLALVEDAPHTLVVDLLGATFVDSTAGRALLHAAQRLREQGARLVVVNRDPEVARILEVMGLDEFLDVVPDADAGG
jgi:anti-sigma B factor antagonist